MPTGSNICMLLLLSLTVASPAAGQYRFMGWNDSHPGDRDMSPDCAQLPDQSTLVISFQVPEGCTSAERIEAALDFCTLPEPLPEWWRFDVTTGCRYQRMSVSANFSSGPATHLNPWDPQHVQISAEYFPEWQGNPVLAHVEITVTPDSTVTLLAGEEYYAFKVHFDNSGGPCSGCDMPTCFVLNSLAVFSSTEDPGCWTSMDGYGTYSTWQIGHPSCPFIVPVRKSTWGSIKAQY